MGAMRADAVALPPSLRTNAIGGRGVAAGGGVGVGAGGVQPAADTINSSKTNRRRIPGLTSFFIR
jgi:hypothetical protein